MVISKINDTYQMVKNTLEAEIAVATADQKMKLADALVALANMKIAHIELEEENIRLRKLKDVVIGRSGAVWESGIAYCGGCHGAKDRLVPLSRFTDSVSDCPNCKARYNSLRSDRLKDDKIVD